MLLNLLNEIDNHLNSKEMIEIVVEIIKQTPTWKEEERETTFLILLDKIANVKDRLTQDMKDKVISLDMIWPYIYPNALTSKDVIAKMVERHG